MSTTEKNTPRIINSYDQCIAAGGDRIMICYLAQNTGRFGGHSAAWVVYRIKDGIELPTDRNGHWRHYGHKYFYPNGRADIRNCRLRAENWVAAQYGRRDFVRNRMRDYVEREVNERFPIPKEDAKSE
jgi:hypothetical protein